MAIKSARKIDWLNVKFSLAIVVTMAVVSFVNANSSELWEAIFYPGSVQSDRGVLFSKSGGHLGGNSDVVRYLKLRHPVCN
jgi:hypothetical protein